MGRSASGDFKKRLVNAKKHTSPKWMSHLESLERLAEREKMDRSDPMQSAMKSEFERRLRDTARR